MAEFIGVDDLRAAGLPAIDGSDNRIRRQFCNATRQCDITLAHHILM